MLYYHFEARLILASLYLKPFDGSALTTENTRIFSMEYESFHNLAGFLSQYLVSLSLTKAPADANSF